MKLRRLVKCESVAASILLLVSVLFSGCVANSAFSPARHAVKPLIDPVAAAQLPEGAGWKVLAERAEFYRKNSPATFPYCEFDPAGYVRVLNGGFPAKGAFVQAILKPADRNSGESIRVMIYPSDMQGVCVAFWAIPHPYQDEWRRIMTAAQNVGMEYYCDHHKCSMADE